MADPAPQPTSDAPRYLVSDIGGTNIRLATFVSDPRDRGDEVTYKRHADTNQPWSVAAALADYLGRFPGRRYAAACLGVAGRVKADSVQITNRPDLIRRADVAVSLGLDPKRVLLVNDMPPHLACVDRLLPAEVATVKPGTGDPRDARAVLMPGTGLGTGGAIPIGGGRHRVFPSEGGHLDFAPRDRQQEQLLSWLRPVAANSGHPNVSNEFAFCGEGLRRVHAFLAGRPTVTPDTPRPEAITASADDLCVATTELYVKLVAAAAGNLALMLAATGGLYLGGSILLSIREQLTTPTFAETFLSSGPPAHRPLLEEVPVRLIDYRDSGLLGAGALALQLE